MKMKEFKFELEYAVNYKGQYMIIVGRAQYVENTDKYLLQGKTHYEENGLNFTQCVWSDENEIERNKQ
jgi:hypothetical protein